MTCNREERVCQSIFPVSRQFPRSPNDNAVIDKDLVGARAIRRVRARVLPFFVVLYIIAYIDRANVTFAKLSMTADLKFSEEVFGFGAGIFFIGYLVLEIPGALIMERWSARIWIARILVTWGIVTILLGFIRTANEFYLLRLLLGLAEAGFFPGLIVYLSRWFPWEERARAMGAFILAVPVSFAVSASAVRTLSEAQLVRIGRLALDVHPGRHSCDCRRIYHFALRDRPSEGRQMDAG